MAGLLAVALCGCLQTAAQTVAAGLADEMAVHVSSYRWRHSDANFGGFSGLWLSPDGGRFIAVSDRGWITRGTITRDGAGRITGAAPEPMRPLRGADGQPLPERLRDAEGIAVGPDGGIHISFEGPARIARHAGFDAPGIDLTLTEAFARMPRNSALEALAIDGRGRLYTLPEDTRESGADFPLYRHDGGWSQPFSIPRRGDFLPVAADFGPDGRFYLLERAFFGIRGFASRVRVFTFSETAITSEAVLFESAPWQHDNLEGLAVWRDGEGAIRLTMVADDNYLSFLRNELVEYRITPAPPPERAPDQAQD
ncbi:esterase-like activity of phytase family protein [Pseudogemmobacter sonorensis]|uniref:esterase-like activity of phytase family protein n=1 Tax=Pseudogemmobacter sonorensis TaxID=2989681 RepID=UPI0036842505